jgi:site-specific recombinase XerD
MSKKSSSAPAWVSAFPDLWHAFHDFILSRKILCSERTIEWYSFTLLKALGWMVENGVTRPEEITARHVRAYLAGLAERGLSDSYVHIHARTIRTMLLFFYEEKYIPERVIFKMPAVEDKKVRYLTAEEIEKLLKACELTRDKAVIATMVDTGLRLAEVCALNWENVDITSGLVQVVRGKGGKPRSVVVGVSTRRTLLHLHKDAKPMPADPVFLTDEGQRLQPRGLRSMLERRGREAGIKVNPHALRHSFATLSLKAGMNPIHLQGLLGHSTMDTTNRYIHMLDEDLLEAHKAHGPMDNILRRR